MALAGVRRTVLVADTDPPYGFPHAIYGMPVAVLRSVPLATSSPVDMTYASSFWFAASHSNTQSPNFPQIMLRISRIPVSVRASPPVGYALSNARVPYPNWMGLLFVS